MSTIGITYDGIAITNRVLYRRSSFQSQLAAQPGTFEIVCKDLSRTDDYVTGKEVVLTVDGTPLYGGYVTQVTRTFALPADEIPSDARLWILRGVDYNILFDKRVIHNRLNYTSQIPTLTGTVYDGAAVRKLAADYLDIPTGFNTTTYVDDTVIINPNGGPYSFAAQGTTWRQQMEDIRKMGATLYYIDGAKNLHLLAYEDVLSSWGFSDVPGGIYIGMREVTVTEDISSMVNDALVWGGSEDAGAVRFYREQDAASQTAHGRWQWPEEHLGEPNYQLQESVTTRAKAIVNGPPGVYEGVQRGLKHPQWQVDLKWWAHQVPAGNHLIAGSVVPINLTTFGAPLDPIYLPLRSFRIDFPNKVAEVNEAHVQFTGAFGVQISDPHSFWSYLRGLRGGRNLSSVASFGDASTGTTYGGLGQFTPIPAPDGTVTAFSLPVGGYILGTLQVYREGKLLPADGYSVTPTSAPGGTFTITPAPSTGDWIHVVVRTS